MTGEAMITSPTNPKIKYVRALARRKTRQREGQFVIEGVRLIEEALRAGTIPALMFFTADLKETARGRALLAAAENHGVTPLLVSNTLMKAMSNTQSPQGVLAVVPFPQIALPPHPSLALIVDGIRDPGNLGTLLRTAQAAGVDMVLLSPGTVDPYNPKVVRSAMGAHFRLPIAMRDWATIAASISRTQVLLADAQGELTYEAVDWRLPSTLIIGSEARGAGSQARQLAVGRVSIPMQGETESMNAAIAAAVILFEAARQRRSASALP